MPQPPHIHHTRASTKKVIKRSVSGGPNKSVTKKDGAGRWNVGKLVDLEAMGAMDPNDPNYDPTEEGGFVLEATE